MDNYANQMLIDGVMKLKNHLKERKNKNHKKDVKVHQLKIDFNVTKEIKRFVYVYIVEGDYCYLIDSGVYGCEEQILAYLKGIGRGAEDIRGIFLTHAHPDHIGSAAWFKEHTGCKIYASKGECPWIEDIDLQFKERPIPNFYQLAGKSTKVDVVVKDGDYFEVEDGLFVDALGTAGHSADEVSYQVGEALFIGDAIPVKGDIPIFVNEEDSRRTFDIIEKESGITSYYPAWDQTYDRALLLKKLQDARELLDILKETVLEIDDGMELPHLVDLVCERLNMPMLKTNPLFGRSIASLRER